MGAVVFEVVHEPEMPPHTHQEWQQVEGAHITGQVVSGDPSRDITPPAGAMAPVTYPPTLKFLPPPSDLGMPHTHQESQVPADQSTIAANSGGPTTLKIGLEVQQTNHAAFMIKVFDSARA